MSDRMVVFVDYQNTYKCAREAFCPDTRSGRDGHIHPLALGKVISMLRNDNGHPAELVQVRSYRGVPDGRKDPQGYGSASRQNDRWEKAGIHVVTRPLRYPEGWPEKKPEEKGVDVALAIDFVVMAMRGEYDVGVLVSCDTDLRPALEEVRLLGKKVEVAAWRSDNGHSPRLSLPGARPVWCHWLGLDSYGRCSDQTDYGDPRAPIAFVELQSQQPTRES